MTLCFMHTTTTTTTTTAVIKNNNAFVERGFPLCGSRRLTIQLVILYSAHFQGSWRLSVCSSFHLLFCHGLLGGGNRMARKTPCCQVGTINTTHMPDGSGQQLRVATIVPRLSRLPTLPTGHTTRPVSRAGLAV